jgi:hypothetical protein
MRFTVRIVLCSLVVCALFGSFQGTLQAGTIMKLSLGGDNTPDVHMLGGELETMNDGNAVTLGEQDTAIDFQDFLAGQTDVLTPTASVILDDVTRVGNATTLGSVVFQNFSGGSIAVLDPSNNLLLSGMLGSSVLAGTLGPPATGGLFTTSLATVTGGSLAPMILPGSLTVSVSLSDVNGGLGFEVDNGILEAFEADASVNIGADQIPEPAAAVLCALGALFSVLGLSRQRC